MLNYLIKDFEAGGERFCDVGFSTVRSGPKTAAGPIRTAACCKGAASVALVVQGGGLADPDIEGAKYAENRAGLFVEEVQIKEGVG